jgi:cytochrome c peroxidase
MSLVNLASSANYNWSDPGTHSLERQALKPMMSTTPIELGFGSVQRTFLRVAATDKIYRPLFRQAFPGEPDPWKAANIARAIAAFERTIVSRDSPYDRYHLHGDEGAISESAKRGEILFYLDGPACFRCHSGIDFTSTAAFHNTGLYNIHGEFSYPPPNLGLFQFTRRPADIGKFKAPTLRNIALTAPYMHDGAIATLEEVIDHYAAGGRTIADGPWAGVGHDNPAKDKLVHGFTLTPRNRADLVAFLRSLTDETLVHNPAFSNPWEQ